MACGDFVINFPAGLIDEGEEFQESAKRELKEETGLDLIEITDVMNEKPERLVLDCAQLEYISSAGLRALLIIAKTAKSAGINVNLCALTDFVVDVLATSGFDSFFEIKGSRND